MPTLCGQSLSKGEKIKLSLQITDTLKIPITVIVGVREGPKLCVTGGVHGDEYEGPRAIADVIKKLDPKSMKGVFIGCPVVNILAYRCGSRLTPDDQKNLARVFPGKMDGTITERIAYVFTEEIILKSDCIIDLHSGGTDYSYMDMVCYFDVPGEVGRRSLEMAQMFPISTLFRSHEKPIGRLIDTAISNGIPTIGTECRGEGRYWESKKDIYISGIRNVMKSLGMISGKVKGLPEKRIFVDLIEVKSEHEGFLKTKLKLGQKVTKDTTLATLVDIFDEEISTFRAPIDGLVCAIKTKPTVKPGDYVFIIGKEYRSGKYWPK
jgi:predicted deacylase